MPRTLRGMSPALRWGAAAAVVAVFVAGLWSFVSSSGRVPDEIVAAAAPAVGRVQVIDISGRATSHANAFAVAQGVMITLCQGFRPNTQVVVKLGARTASARVTATDPKRNLCRLAVTDAATLPLGINVAAPEAGDQAYAASTGEAGETVFAPVKVRGFLAMDGGQVIEISSPVQAAQDGGPLLDEEGRVIGVLAATHALQGRNIALPAAWVSQLRSAPTR